VDGLRLRVAVALRLAAEAGLAATLVVEAAGK